MENNTLYASDLTYEFEKARIEGATDENILKAAQDYSGKKLPEKLEYLDDFYDKDTGTSGTAFKDKDTGEVILAYTGTNMTNNKWKDILEVDAGEIALGLGANHYDPAYKFYEKIRAEYGDDIILTGHSLGGNVAQRVALEYNVQRTIVYNSAPLYIPPSGIKLGELGMVKKLANWALGTKTEEDKINELEKVFTGQVIRIQAKLDVLNNSADFAKGKYIGTEYVLKDAGWHLLSDIVKSEGAKGVIEKITKQLGVTKANIDIDGDGKVDVKLGELDLKRKNLLNDKVSIASGEKIQLSPETLKTLSKNIQTKVLGDLEIIKGITKKCIEKNNKVKVDFEKRKKQVTESVREELGNIGMLAILDKLKESVGEVIDNKTLLEALNKVYEIKMDSFSSNEKPLVNGGDLNSTGFNTQLVVLKNAVDPLLNQCIKEETRDISNLFLGKPTILKSWQEIETITKRLIDESDKTFEGDGLRTGKEDGISQSLSQVLEIANKNIEELEKQLQNTAELTQGLAENFEAQDSWIKGKIEKGVFTGSNPVKSMPTSYKAYLERDEIFDDVKDVIQAFDKQVEKRSKEYAKKVAEEVGGNLDVLVGGLENWIRFVDDAERITTIIEGNYPLRVDVEEEYTEEKKEKGKTKTETKTRTRYWGKFEKLYPQEVITNVAGVKEKILPKKREIEQTIEITKNTRNNLKALEPNLKKIIEEGVYKAFDLDEIVNAQKIVLQMVEKNKAEIKYVKEHIGTEGMSGEAIKALEQKLDEVNKSLEYYEMFIGDCFGDQK